MGQERRPLRLDDLYAIRTDDDHPVVFEAAGQQVKVHVVKLNDADSQAVERRAGAVKARRALALHDTESDDYKFYLNDLIEVRERDELLAAIVYDAMREPAVEIEVRVQERERWKKDDHLLNLLQAWYGETPVDPNLTVEEIEEERARRVQAVLDGDTDIGLMFLHELPPEQSDDPEQQARNDARVVEAARVWAELLQYQDELSEAMTERRDEIVEDHDGDTIEELRHLVVKIFVDLDVENVYLSELNRQRGFYATRQVPEWRKRYFADLSEWDNLPQPVKHRILSKLQELEVGEREGKGLAGTLGSSPSSNLSAAAETSVPSGHATASA